MINCSVEVERDAELEEVWKNMNDTGLFANLAGKKKQDMFFTEIVWTQTDSTWAYKRHDVLCLPPSHGLRMRCGLGSM